MKSITPIACGPVYNPELVRRHVFCRHYDTCLDYAIQKNWHGFSCEQCEGYDLERRSLNEWDEDHTRCATLMLFSMIDNEPTYDELRVFEMDSCVECLIP